MGKNDVHADTWHPGLMGSAIGGFHDAGTAAGHHNQLIYAGVAGNQMAQFARLVIISTVFKGPGEQTSLSWLPTGRPCSYCIQLGLIPTGSQPFQDP